jgi:hypothetical protein
LSAPEPPAFRERRDRTDFLAPDFQAQLMEEEVGTDYFNVWQSLETSVFGPAHANLDELTVEHFPGYVPHYYFVYASCLVQSEPSHPDQALELIRRARQVGAESQNFWAGQYADYLEREIAKLKGH